MKKYKIFYNSNNWPKRYRSEYIEPGVCSYEDLGLGVIFISDETLNKMQKTFLGKPIVNEDHQDMTPEQAYKLSEEDLESMADGIVYNVGKLPNGWYYNDFIVWNQETKKNIDEKKYNVSCAYYIDEEGPKGSWHNIAYDGEVLNGAFTHHAIVPNPRYERSKVYSLDDEQSNDEIGAIIQNSKGVNEMKKKIFKHVLNSLKKKNIKNQEPPAKEEDEKKKKDEAENTNEQMQNMEGAYIELEDGQKVPLEEAVNAYKAAKENQEKEVENEKVIGPDDEVDVEGEMVTGAELIAACGAMKKNAEPVQDEKAEEVVEEQSTMKNSIKKPKKSFFKVVKNACERTEEFKTSHELKSDRFKRGKENYSLVKEGA